MIETLIIVGLCAVWAAVVCIAAERLRWPAALEFAVVISGAVGIALLIGVLA